MKKWFSTIMIVLTGGCLICGSAGAAEYYKFRFVCSDRGGTTYSDWMDERISQSVTMKNRTYLSCNTVSLVLRPLDSWFDLSPSQSKERMHLWRETAPVPDDPNAPIVWRDLSDLGEPDEVQYTTSSHNPDAHRRERGYQWNTKWNDGYWMLKYQYGGGGRRRVKVRFIDQDNYTHWFYAVPWAD